MKIFDLTSAEGYAPHRTSSVPRGCAVVFGFFDGVHLGHAALLDAARSYAKKVGVPLCVWMFSSLPKSACLLTTNPQKLYILSKYADYAVFEDYDAVRDVSPIDFFDGCIMNTLAPSAVFCGFNFRYGKGASASADDLVRSADRHGIYSYVLPPYEVDGDPLSSSFIRSLISSCELERASSYLAAPEFTLPFSFTSEVVRGRHIGLSIGFPTINQSFPENRTPPRFGVYACTVAIDGNEYGGVCNIGVRPTIDPNEKSITIETHIFDYSGDAYGKTVTVSLAAMLRAERRFSSREELSRAIAQDSAAARKILSETDV